MRGVCFCEKWFPEVGAGTHMPMTAGHGAERRTSPRIDLAADAWAYQPEISRQLAKTKAEVVWGGDALALREAIYIRIN
mgnify:CR=1 FL=1